MATESLLPSFSLETSDPNHDPILSQLMGQATQEDLLNDLILGDDLLSSLLETQPPVPSSSQASPVLQNFPGALDPAVFPVHPSPVTSDGYLSDSSSHNKAYSPASFTSDYLGDPAHADVSCIMGLDGHIMEPTVSTTAPSPTYSTGSDVKIDVDLVSRDSTSPPPSLPCEGKTEMKATTLFLTDEEKRMLAEEGVVLPTDMPLTKAEQKHLKRVRRKIKNKISAQESRKRKKEYVDGLEHRVEKCTQINQQLQKKVNVLELENKSLLSQLKKLQTIVAQHYPSRLQAGTIVMVLTLSFSLFFVPHLRHGSPPGSSYHTLTVQSRSLLFMETDEFGNIVDPDSGKVISEAGGQSPVLPPPWTYQTPAFNLLNQNSSLYRTH